MAKKKLSKEFETFMGDRMKGHDSVMKKSDSWLKGKDKELNKLDAAADGFEAEMERAAQDMEKWIVKKSGRK
ncbi:hypothetical protein [Metabacillus sp. 84]|uniref:hypothetical protein n=1 Tax=unclassified Metabacillus TaxID=2675274 RepID=UPI003CF2593C